MNLRALIAIMFAGLLVWPQSASSEPTLLFEPDSGTVLYAEEADRVWHPASITKIMTAYVTFEAIKAGKLTLDTKIKYSALAQRMPASKIGLSPGAEVSLDFALRALIIKSANDIAVAIAEAVGGSHDTFVARMNETAKRLGMTRTKFVNPNGLPSPEQVTTARDLARLARAVQADFPEHAAYWSMSKMRVGRRRLRSHNSLLRNFEGADGMKTGFICDSGFNVIASATRDGRRLIAIVLGERTGRVRALRAATLLEHGFTTYRWKTYFNAPKLDDLAVSTTETTPTSIRAKVPMGACNPRLARARARAARRARRNRARAAAKRRNNKVSAAKARRARKKSTKVK